MNYTVLGRRAGAFEPPPLSPLHPKRIENGRDDKTLSAHREILLETRYNREYIRRTTAPTFTLRGCASHAIRLSICLFFCFFFFFFFLRSYSNHVVRLGIAEVFFFFFYEARLFDRDLDLFVCFFFFTFVVNRANESSLSVKRNYCISEVFL